LKPIDGVADSYSPSPSPRLAGSLDLRYPLPLPLTPTSYSHYQHLKATLQCQTPSLQKPIQKAIYQTLSFSAHNMMTLSNPLSLFFLVHRFFFYLFSFLCHFFERLIPSNPLNLPIFRHAQSTFSSVLISSPSPPVSLFFYFFHFHFFCLSLCLSLFSSLLSNSQLHRLPKHIFARTV